jgi:hypothetical protein
VTPSERRQRPSHTSAETAGSLPEVDNRNAPGGGRRTAQTTVAVPPAASIFCLAEAENA